MGAGGREFKSRRPDSQNPCKWATSRPPAGADYLSGRTVGVHLLRLLRPVESFRREAEQFEFGWFEGERRGDLVPKRRAALREVLWGGRVSLQGGW